MDRYGQPEIFNTDQGVQFTSGDFIDELAARGVRISMDGKGRFLDNIFIERFAAQPRNMRRCSSRPTPRLARHVEVSVGGWPFTTMCVCTRPLNYRTPREMFEVAPGSWICGQRKRVAHIPTGSPPQQQKDSIDDQNVICSFAALVARGRGICNRWEALLAHPVSCPTDGVHLSDRVEMLIWVSTRCVRSAERSRALLEISRTPRR